MSTTKTNTTSVFFIFGALFCSLLKGQDTTTLKDPRAHQHHQLPLPIAPRFPGGKDSLTAFIKKNTHYPAPATKKHITGTVEVDFTVDEKGKLTNIHVVKSLSYSCDKEALRVVKKMPLWSPGMDGRNPKAMDYSVDIIFAEPEKK